MTEVMTEVGEVKLLSPPNKPYMIALLSGGLDSAVALALEQAQVDRCVAFSYGQHHEEKELDAALDIASHYEKPIDFVKLPTLEGSELTDGVLTLDGDGSRYENECPPTYVPQRNMIFIAHAASIAEVYGLQTILGGWHARDVGYPDCTQAFLATAEQALRIGSPHEILRILRPLIFFSKVHIVLKAKELHVPVHLTWSCYAGGEVHCGRCGTCQQRISAFQYAALIDPVPYAVDVDWARCKKWE